MSAVMGQTVTMTDQASPYSQPAAGAMRTYKNFVVFGAITTFQVCSFYNGTVSNCISVAYECRDVLFYEPVENDIYLIVAGNTFINIYKVQATTTGVLCNLFWTTNGAGYGTLFTVDIDYQHRWMALGGPTKMFLFDIRDMSRIVNTDSTTFPFSINTLVYAKMISFRRNLVCQSASDTANQVATFGIFCCPVANGRFTGACTQRDSSSLIFSLKVYDDYIITCGLNSGIRIFDASTRQFLGSIAGKCLYFIRSNNWIVYNNWWDFQNIVVNIASAASPSNAVVTGGPERPHGIFINEWGLYHITGSIRQLILNTGQSHLTFFSNSDHFGVGPAINPLQASAITSYVFGETSRLLNATIKDTWLPNDVSIVYTVDTLPTDYCLDRFQGGKWARMELNTNFSQADVSAGNVRVRTDLQPNPTARNLNQTFRLIVTNGRSSFLTINLWATRVFSGSDCPRNAICNGSSLFTCQPGTTLNITGTDCTSCTLGFYKPLSGNHLCSICPANVLFCNSTSFICNVGYEINATSDGCSPCGASTYKTTASNTACILCPANSVCTSTAFTCNAGFELNTANTGCGSCSGNFYKSTASNDACTPCPSGATCTSRAFTCNTGYGLNATGTGCQLCGVSSYKATASNDACTPCPSGATCTSTAFTCNAGYGLNAISSGCALCETGTFKAETGNRACEACPNNSLTCNTTAYTCPANMSLNGNSCMYFPKSSSTTASSTPTPTAEAKDKPLMSFQKFLITNPILVICLIITIWFIMLVVGFLFGSIRRKGILTTNADPIVSHQYDRMKYTVKSRNSDRNVIGSHHLRGTVRTRASYRS